MNKKAKLIQSKAEREKCCTALITYRCKYFLFSRNIEGAMASPFSLGLDLEAKHKMIAL